MIQDQSDLIKIKRDDENGQVLRSITTFDTFVTLVVVQVALHPLVPLSAMLQDKEIDLIEAVTERTDPIEMMMYTGTKNLFVTLF